MSFRATAVLALLILALPARAAFIDGLVDRPSRQLVDPQVSEAASLLQQGRIEAARSRFEQVLERRPDEVAALLGLADIAHLQGRAADVERLLRQALRAEPTNASVQTAMGRL